jgi:hypothetical protein
MCFMHERSTSACFQQPCLLLSVGSCTCFQLLPRNLGPCMAWPPNRRDIQVPEATQYHRRKSLHISTYKLAVY